MRIDQPDLRADARKGDRRALRNRDAQLVGQQPHDRSMFYPWQLLQGCLAPGKGDEEDVAADVSAKDRKQLFARQLAVTDGLDRG